MRIAYICSDVGIPVFGTKGASVHVREVVGALQALGHSVRVFSPAIDSAEVTPGDATFLPVPLAGMAAEASRLVEADVPEPDHLAAEWSRLLYNEFLQRTIAPQLEAMQPDVIYERYSLFGYAGAEIAARLGIPFLLEVNAPLVQEQQKYRRLVLKESAEAIELHVLKRADAIFVVSQALADFARSRCAGAAKITVLPNAVSPERFHPGVGGDEVRLRYGLEGKFVVGFVGSLKAWHDVDTLIEAARRLYAGGPDVRLLVVGDGPRLPDLQAIDEPFLVCTGGVPYEAVPPHLAACDVVAVPYSRHEDQYFSPLKLFEAMAMAKPVVGARLGQVAEVITDGVTGRLYEPDDAADLALKLREVKDSPDRGQRLGREAMAGVLADHTWLANGRRIEAVARRLTTGLLRDERLPYLGLVWSPERMCEFLNASVAPQLLDGAKVAGASLRDLTYRPARQCISTFDLTLDHDGRKDEQRAVISFVKDDRFVGVYDKHYAGDDSLRAAYLPEQRCLIELFPADWELPALARLYEPASARELMREAGVPLNDSGALKSNVLAYRAHEACVIAYEGDGGMRAVAKTTSQSRKAEHVHGVAQMLRRQLDPAYVSTPATYRPKSERFALFMDVAPGLSLHDTLAAASVTGRRDILQLTARSLAALHSAGIEARLKEKRTLPQGLDHARERAARLQFAAPDLGRKAEALLDQIAPFVTETSADLTFLHGDFKGTQVLIDNGRLSVIDLDSACIGDPAVDAGNMMADLYRDAAFSGRSYAREAAHLFLEDYVALSGRHDVAKRAPVFMVIALVRMSVHGFRQHANTYSDPNSQPQLLLREAEACLAAL
jgi:glycosyltransferase involved in cell wall biosynthesis/aminoglycoside phosphotransferase (APT) family kinase protein